MPYDDSTDTGAADELTAENPDEGQTARDDTFFLPSDFPGSDALKAGDTLTLRVVGKDADGDIEVEHVAGEPAKSGMMDDLRTSMTKGM